MKIVTDSVASIPQEVARDNDIEVVSLFINHRGEEFVDAEMNTDAFYSEIASMADDIPTSSQPSQQAFESIFEAAARVGEAVLGMFISSGLSGTFDGAVRAARSVSARNIGFRYALVDSLSCGFDEAFPVLEAVRLRDAGATLKECVAGVLKTIAATRFLFAPESLTFLRKGGRIGNAAGLIGNLMKLVPVLTVTDGQATPLAKAHTSKKALERIVEMMREDAEKLGLRHAVVHYIGDKTPAQRWAKEIIEPLLGRRVEVLPVSPVIGLHVGPAVGIAYECAEKVPDKLVGLTPSVSTSAAW